MKNSIGLIAIIAAFFFAIPQTNAGVHVGVGIGFGGCGYGHRGYYHGGYCGGYYGGYYYPDYYYGAPPYYYEPAVYYAEPPVVIQQPVPSVVESTPAPQPAPAPQSQYTQPSPNVVTTGNAPPFGYITSPGVIKSPWSDATVSAAGKTHGQVVYDSNTGKPFRIP